MINNLIRNPNLTDPDRFYAALIAAHSGLDDEHSELLNARLILILANHIGDGDVLKEALEAAKLPTAAAP